MRNRTLIVLTTLAAICSICLGMIGFKELRDDGTVVLCDVLMKHALENIAKTGRASVLAVDAETMAAYQIIGSAAYETSGPVFEEWKQNADAMTGEDSDADSFL